MELGLQNKVVLITGASKGLGAAIATAFAEEGSKLILVARTQSELDQVAANAEELGASAVLTIAADLTQTNEIDRVVSKAIAQFSTIHVLVNNAGILGSFSSFADLTDDEWLQVFNLNLFSVVKLTRAILPYMVQQHWGRIINLSSESGLQPDAAMPHYAATKAALLNLTKSLSKAYGQHGVLVNSVSPAFIKTPMVEAMLKQIAQDQHLSIQDAEAYFLKENRPHIELKRGGTAAEVAAAVVFLASEAASFIIGTNLRVDGGSVASI
ncbi:glucose 1-dehydrogenase [Leptolyngbya sp. NK1-12]|uniref:Glucose 1-dehydrogenase n=1 Tax=Leptolyngbya sp. NK1-12 TaxID=2547451 RepID=A0AA97AK83_9CYAN|nr:glucose 1-dehydrogenase [Leptolyngbya sp. NK1-12]WNZ25786.1 glucose 1-dehydrogenase [Leptolyngbya sp. NK1-12]